MGIVAIMVIRPEPFEQIFNLPLIGCCIKNLTETGLAGSEEKSFEKVDDADDAKDADDTDDEDDADDGQ